jgi:hypothetical protein
MEKPTLCGPGHGAQVSNWQVAGNKPGEASWRNSPPVGPGHRAHTLATSNERATSWGRYHGETYSLWDQAIGHTLVTGSQQGETSWRNPPSVGPGNRANVSDRQLAATSRGDLVEKSTLWVTRPSGKC